MNRAQQGGCGFAWAIAAGVHFQAVDVVGDAVEQSAGM